MSDLKTYNKYYLYSIYAGILLFLETITGLLFNISPDDSSSYLIKATVITLWGFFIFSTIATIVELYSFARVKATDKLNNIDVINKYLLNFFIAVISFLIYVYSTFKIEQFVNKLTEVDSSNFQSGLLCLRIIFIPYTWAIILLILLPIIFFVSLSLTFSEDTSKSKSILTTINLVLLKKYKSFIIVAGNIVILMVLIVTIENSYKKDSLVYSIASSLFINSEYFPYSSCERESKYKYVAQLKGGDISLYDPIKHEFKKSKCTVIEAE